jgi:hypothetical protein
MTSSFPELESFAKNAQMGFWTREQKGGPRDQGVCDHEWSECYNPHPNTHLAPAFIVDGRPLETPKDTKRRGYVGLEQGILATPGSSSCTKRPSPFVVSMILADPPPNSQCVEAGHFELHPS